MMTYWFLISESIITAVFNTLRASFILDDCLSFPTDNSVSNISVCEAFATI